MTPKVWLVIAGFVLTLASAVGAYYSPQPFWQPLLISVATTFFALAIAVIAVNLYLERDKRREAVRALLLLSNEAIATYHNTFLNVLWKQFGKMEFGKIRVDYVTGGGDPNAITPADREKIYQLAKTHAKELTSLVEILDESLSELTTLVGWDLDVDLLTDVLRSRFSVRKFRNLAFDGSDDAKKGVCEHLIDLDNSTQDARNRLLEIAEIKDR